MKNSPENTKGRPFRITIRFSDQERQLLNRRQQESTAGSISDYIRSVLLKGKITIRQRNDSLDRLINEFTQIRTQMQAVGNNFNQVVKRINQFKEPEAIVLWRASAEKYQQELLAKINSVEQRIEKAYKLWSQK